MTPFSLSAHHGTKEERLLSTMTGIEGGTLVPVLGNSVDGTAAVMDAAHGRQLHTGRSIKLQRFNDHGAPAASPSLTAIRRCV